MEAMFRRTGGADFNGYLKVMISGPPKSGKTTLLGTVPNIVIGDTEPFANNLQSIAHLNVPYMTIGTLDDVHRMRLILADDSLRTMLASQLGMPKIEACAIDTLDTLQAIMKTARMKEQHQSQFLRDDWGWLKEEMTSIIQAFTALPMHVFFTVHLKSKELGKGDNAHTVILPGLEGAIAESIAGMVGYSLLSFRRDEVRPDGSPYTRYFLRTEGNETYDFIGNRAAGRLPDIIDPNFQSILAAAQAGQQAAALAAQQAAAPEQVTLQVAQDRAAVVQAALQPQLMAPVQPPVQTQAPAPAPAVASAPAQAPSAATLAPAQTAQAPAPAGPPSDNDEPVNGAALAHTKKVYDALGLAFPEEIIRGLTMGQARFLVKSWHAINQDHVQGKGDPGETPQSEMTKLLEDMKWLSAEPAPQPDLKIVEPDLHGTVEQVMAYVGDDLTKVQEAYDLEAAKPKPRSSLVNALVNKGAKVPTVVQFDPDAVGQVPDEAKETSTAAATPAVTPAAPVASPVDTAPPVTSEPPVADAATEQEAIANVEATLGGTVISVDGPCEECGNQIDDPDIAVLSRSRFGRRLCVSDYIAETKKPRQ